MTDIDGMDGGDCMSRKHPWDFKNRREQHKHLVNFEQCYKYALRHMHHGTAHTKERWRKAEYIRGRDWIIKARLNGLIK